MKNLYIIGGAMGVGKTTACMELNKLLEKSVFLDGDWCWNMDPFVVNEETKSMVLDNICHLLNNFIGCSELENIIFCWVMDEQKIIDDILKELDVSMCRVISVSLMCSEKELEKRINRDVEDGKRDCGVLSRSLLRLPKYRQLNTVKIDVSELSPRETAEKIAAV